MEILIKFSGPAIRSSDLSNAYLDPQENDLLSANHGRAFTNKWIVNLLGHHSNIASLRKRTMFTYFLNCRMHSKDPAPNVKRCANPPSSRFRIYVYSQLIGRLIPISPKHSRKVRNVLKRMFINYFN